MAAAEAFLLQEQLGGWWGPGRHSAKHTGPAASQHSPMAPPRADSSCPLPQRPTCEHRVGLFTGEVAAVTRPAIPVVHSPGMRTVPTAQAGKPRLREVRPSPVLHGQEEVALGPLGVISQHLLGVTSGQAPLWR